MAYLLIQILYNPINTDLTKYFINDSVVKEYWDYIMHLTYSDSKYKGKTYKSYSIAESYRDGKKVRKRILWPIGKLSDIQAEQIKLICKTVEKHRSIADSAQRRCSPGKQGISRYSRC
ncbi:hypothetical protein [Candidatus Kuenenia stuttgartiensis]|uniref:hypothetical protein n=1 Tax=Kuenenia stuttgartiensis TaxID=174633 RepID=UPI00146C7B0D|nr:hypothetical protein [Candidatus Kuenenia stuttgartiensis]